VFRNDESGEASLDFVKILAQKIHASKYAVPVAALTPFLQLKLNTSLRKQQEPEKPSKPKKGEKTKKQHVTKRQKKENKYLKQAEEEFREAEAVYDKEHKEKMQTETLKCLFQVYFKILKSVPKSALIPVVLQGLAKYVNLINVDFFDDLLRVLKMIAKTHHNEYLQGQLLNSTSPIIALHCIIAVFELMDSVGDALNVDLNEFYVVLYTQVHRLASRPTDGPKTSEKLRNEVELLIKGVEYMLKKNREVCFINSGSDRSGSFFCEKIGFTCSLGTCK
jgi:nucleolar complex protein 3